MPPAKFLTDDEALSAFVGERSEEAFAALVDRYADMVYGTASRKSVSQQLAEEAAQNVFALLAKKAASLRSSKALGTWLHRAAILETRNLVRGESNHRRKMERYSQNLDTPDDDAWDDSTPELDEAINKLPEADRRIILLRFYSGLSFKEIGERLGTSDDTCQKRTSRALEKLSAILERRGIALPAAAIASGLAAHVAEAAPAAIKISLAKSALTASSATSSTSLIHLMNYTNWKLAAATLIAAAIPLSLQWSQNSTLAAQMERLREENRSLENPTKPLGSAIPKTDSADASSDPIIRQLKKLITRVEAAPHRRRAVAALVDSLRQLPAESMPQAYQLIISSPLNAFHSQANLDILSALFGRWGEIEPKIGIEHALEVYPNGSSAVSAVFESWIRHDPDAAVSALQDARPRLARNWTSVMESTFRSLALHAPAEAARLVTNFDGGSKTDNLVGNVGYNWAAREPLSAITWAASLENETQRHRALRFPLRDLARKDAPLAAAHAPSLKFGRERDQIYRLIRRNWSKSDPEAAEQWFSQQEFSSPPQP